MTAVRRSLVSKFRDSRGASFTGALRGTSVVLKRNLWAWPILTALVLGLLGWWVNGTVERKAREQLAAHVTTLLNADVTALRIWLKDQEGNAQLIATMEPLQRPV